MSDKVLNDDLRLRINADAKNTFIEKSKKITGLDYQIFIRQMVDAFNDGRLRIIPTEEQKEQQAKLGDLYDDK